jgi:hypothetical protein
MTHPAHCLKRLSCIALALVLGCGSGLPEAADPATATDALRTALDCWKQGEAPEALQQRRPPIVVNEPEWTAGNRLVNFDVTTPPEPFGRQLRCTVKLSLRDRAGASYEKRIGYQIDTNPNIVIVREGL